MRVLLTGAKGVIGRCIRQDSFSLGTELLTTSRTPACSGEQEHHCADLSDAEEAAALIKFVRPTHLIHTAWETRPPTYWEDDANLAWAESAARMAAAFGEIGGRRFVQVGTCAEYDWSDGLCTEYSTPDRPLTLYGKSKLAAFRAIEAIAHHRFELVEARVFFVYGPGEHADRLVPIICRAHLTGQKPELSSGRQKRDFLHSSDAARGLVTLAHATGLEGVVNVGSGIATPLTDVAQILAQLAGTTETGIGKRPDREDEPSLLVASPVRLQQTGWAPSLSLHKGLSKVFDWWRSELKKKQQ